MTRATSALLLGLLLASCGGANAASGGADGARADFDSMTAQQQGRFMERVVMPAMKPMFRQFDADEFRGFSCASCHGSNAQAVHFRMPNTLRPLDPAHMPAADGNDARWVRFMEEQVTPKMAELLGRERWAPANPQGFGCFGCHAMASTPAGAAQGASAVDDDDDHDDPHATERGEHGEREDDDD